ncbi:MAG: transcriptional repressor [Actinomycetota bacterium]|nr:transcriptional repressor [Actinomycetota bacterium]
MSIDEVLRAQDFRVTRARTLVWQVLDEAQSHLSAADILQRVHDYDESINSSSVYRALSLFAELELVRETRQGELSTWEPAHDDAVIHLRCELCDITIHFDAPTVNNLRKQVGNITNFTPTSIDVRISGVCETCSSAT